MAWPEALDALERHLQAVARTLDGADPPVDTPHVPSEPLPPELRRRAEALLLATRTLETVIADRLAILARRRAHHAGSYDGLLGSSSPPTYVDRRA
jgi:hypothetical protein